MKKIIPLLSCCFLIQFATAQKNKQLSFAITSSQSAMPFSRFTKLATHPDHPGFEFGYISNLKTKKKHDWFHDYRLGYFYHRFVQHSISLYTDLGYRYKFNQTFSSHAAIGAGYMHSIPATGLYKLDNDGSYKNHKGIGRSQVIASFELSLAGMLNPAGTHPIKLFITYQQRLQFPFVKSYVPLLPYNNLMIGAAIKVKHVIKNSKS